jgi:hypothetical protein
MSTGRTIILHLAPLPCDVPVVVRVRQALKTLPRRDRLRCVRIDGDGLGESEKASAPSVGADAAPERTCATGGREKRTIDEVEGD